MRATPDRMTRAVMLAREIRARRCGGAVTCCCHVVVDDTNYADAHATFCLDEARRQQHADCEELAAILVTCSYTQRKKINRRAWLW